MPHSGSNLLLVRNSDKKLRLCIDLTSVNRAIMYKSYPSPTFDQQMSRLTGFTKVSKLISDGATCKLSW